VRTTRKIVMPHFVITFGILKWATICLSLPLTKLRIA